MSFGTSIISHPQLRELFLEDYIASNCTIEFDPSTSLDDTVGTYATNYLIGVLGILFGSLFLSRIYQCCSRQSTSPSTISQTQTTALFWQALYFLLTAAGYGAAGFQHQFYSTLDNLPAALVLAAGILVILSNVPLQLSVTEVWDTSKWTTILLRLLPVCLAVAVTAITVVFQTIVPVGIYNFIILFFTTGYYIQCFCCSGCQIMRYVAVMGNALIMAGLLVQVLLTPTCGSLEAYQNCFRDCLMPDPLHFNHNALFHLLVAIGLIFQAIGWWRWPVDEEKKSAMEQDSDSFSSSNV